MNLRSLRKLDLGACLTQRPTYYAGCLHVGGVAAFAFPQYAVWLGIGSAVLGGLSGKGFLNNRQAS